MGDTQDGGLTIGKTASDVQAFTSSCQQKEWVFNITLKSCFGVTYYILHSLYNMSASLKEPYTENGRRVFSGCFCVFWLISVCLFVFSCEVGRLESLRKRITIELGLTIPHVAFKLLF